MVDALFAGEMPWCIGAWVVWCASAALLSSALTYAVLQLAPAIGVIDRPNARSSHSLPTPRGGGLAIVAVSLMVVVTLIGMRGEPPVRGEWLLLGGLIVAAVSFLDDIAPVSHRVRLLTHVGVALIAVIAAGPIHLFELGSFGMVDIGSAGWVLTVLWVVGMTNAFNFMDGIDGIAGITAAVSLAVLSIAFFVGNSLFASLFAAALASAAVGFMAWNWQPARIFMGDVGSAFLGYAIAVLPLVSGDELRGWLFQLTAIVMWPFLFDTAYTLMRRLAKGENVFEAHRSHLYQRLVIAGWSHRAVATLYGALSAVAGGAMLVSHGMPAASHLAGFMAMSSVLGGAVGLLILVHGAEGKIACRAAS